MSDDFVEVSMAKPVGDFEQFDNRLLKITQSSQREQIHDLVRLGLWLHRTQQRLQESTVDEASLKSFADLGSFLRRLMVVESCLGVTQRLSLTRVWRAYLLLMPEGGAGVLEMLTWMSSQLRSAVDTGKLQLTIYPPQVSVVIEVLTGCLLDHHQHAVAVFVETSTLSVAWEGLTKLCSCSTILKSGEQLEKIDSLIGAELATDALENLMNLGYSSVSRNTRRAMVKALVSPPLVARLALLIDEEAGFPRQESIWRYLMKKRDDTNRLFIAEACAMALASLKTPILSLNWVLECLKEGRMMRPNKIELIKKAIPPAMLADEQTIIIKALLDAVMAESPEEWPALGPKLLVHPDCWLYWRLQSLPPPSIDELSTLQHSVSLAPFLHQRPIVAARLFEKLFIQLKGEAALEAQESDRIVDRLLEVISCLNLTPDRIFLLDAELVQHAHSWATSWAQAKTTALNRWQLLKALGVLCGVEAPKIEGGGIGPAILGQLVPDIDLKTVLSTQELPLVAMETILAQFKPAEEEHFKLLCQLSLRVAHEFGQVRGSCLSFDGCREADQVFLLSKIEFYTDTQPSVALIQLAGEWLKGKGRLVSEKVMDKCQAIIALYLTSPDAELRRECHRLMALLAKRAGAEFSHALHDDLLRRTIQHQDHPSAPLYLEACVALSLNIPAEQVNLHVLLGILFSLGKTVGGPLSLRKAAFEGLRQLLPLALDTHEHETLASMVLKEHLTMLHTMDTPVRDAFYGLVVALCLSPGLATYGEALHLLCLDLLQELPAMGIEAAHHLILFGHMQPENALLNAIEAGLGGTGAVVDACLLCLELIAERHPRIWSQQAERMFPLLVQIYAAQPQLFASAWWEESVWRLTIEEGWALWSLLWQAKGAALSYARLCMRQAAHYPRPHDLYQQLARLALRLTQRPVEEAGYMENQEAALELVSFLLDHGDGSGELLPVLTSAMTPLLAVPRIGLQLAVRLSHAMRTHEHWRQPRLAKLLPTRSCSTAFDKAHSWVIRLNLALSGLATLDPADALALSRMLLLKLEHPMELISFTEYTPGASFTQQTLPIWPLVCRSRHVSKPVRQMIFKRALCLALLLPPSSQSVNAVSELMMLDEMVGEARLAVPDVCSRLPDFCLDRSIVGQTLSLLLVLVRRFKWSGDEPLQLCKHLFSSCLAREVVFSELLEVLQELGAEKFFARVLFEFIGMSEAKEDCLRHLAVALTRVPPQLPIILAGDSIARLRLASVTLSVHAIDASQEELLGLYGHLFKKHLSNSQPVEPFMLLTRGLRHGDTPLVGLVMDLSVAILKLADPSPFHAALLQVQIEDFPLRRFKK